MLMMIVAAFGHGCQVSGKGWMNRGASKKVEKISSHCSPFRGE